MQITVEIPDDVAQKIQANGESPEEFVQKLIERVPPDWPAAPEPKLDLKSFFERMAIHSDKIPQLPDEAFTRESFYSDHD